VNVCLSARASSLFPVIAIKINPAPIIIELARWAGSYKLGAQFNLDN
jgi:hypothetical protein